MCSALDVQGEYKRETEYLFQGRAFLSIYAPFVMSTNGLSLLFNLESLRHLNDLSDDYMLNDNSSSLNNLLRKYAAFLSGIFKRNLII